MQQGGAAAVRKSLGDMTRSLAVMAVIVAAMLFVGGRYLIFPSSSDRAPAVDYSGVVTGFASVTQVPALAPHGLPSSWRANAARLLAPAAGVEQLHIGWAVPGTAYAGLDESTGDPQRLFRAVLGKRGATTTGTTDIGGNGWQQRVSDRGERALTRQAGRVTVVITGNASDAQLRALAASLR